VEARSAWGTQAWISVGTVTARSDVVTFEDTNAAPRRFYRIGGSIR
jgi:hypothetical protein